MYRYKEGSWSVPGVGAPNRSVNILQTVFVNY